MAERWIVYPSNDGFFLDEDMKYPLVINHKDKFIFRMTQITVLCEVRRAGGIRRDYEQAKQELLDYIETQKNNLLRFFDSFALNRNFLI